MDVKEELCNQLFCKKTYEKNFDSEKDVEESVVVGYNIRGRRTAYELL